MKNDLLLSENDTLEILDAAYCALEYALNCATAIAQRRSCASEMTDSLAQSMESVKNAWSNHTSHNRLRGHVANALRYVRIALMAGQDMNDESDFSSVIRASARALSLIFPLTQTEGPLLLVPRKKPGRTRRKLPVISGRRTRHPPVFEVVLGTDAETNFFAGFEGSISSGGLFIATYDIYPIGTLLNVRATLPGGHMLDEESTVSWIREYNENTPDISPGMGVVFNNISQEDSQKIDSYMAKHEAIFYEAV